jgi:hypothetical protein
MFFRQKPPRKFNYTPRFTKPERTGKIKFPRITFYQPRAKKPFLYIGLLLLVILFYYYLTGGKITFKTKVEDLKIMGEDAVMIDTLTSSQGDTRP